MVASLIPVSTASPMVYTQNEATAAERTMPFYLSNTADGSAATGKTISGTDFRISKDGAAFAAAAGTVTEMSLGWYKMVFATADLDTIGALVCDLEVEAGVDPLRVVHRVQAFDQNVANVTLADSSLSAAKFAGDALTALGVPVKTFTTTKTVHLSATGDPAISMKDCTDVVITATGTWSGATLQPQVCEDPTATVPVWTNSGSALTADGSKTITGPHNAVRAHVTGGSGATDLSIVFASHKPAALV